MSTDDNALMPVTESPVTITRAPDEVLTEAKRAAKALQDVITKKAKPVIFGGEQYLEFEDWQTVATFYNCVPKVMSVKAIELGDKLGFEAHAVVIHKVSKEEISGAFAMCMTDEKNWSDKPIFQLASMAQTRACAKALRNAFSWVVVLAGYRPTPAEEMTDVTLRQAPKASRDIQDEPITKKDVAWGHQQMRQKIEAEALANMSEEEYKESLALDLQESVFDEAIWKKNVTFWQDKYPKEYAECLKVFHVKNHLQLTTAQKQQFTTSMQDRITG